MHCPLCGEAGSTPGASFFPRFQTCPRCGGHFLHEPAAAAYAAEYFRAAGRPSIVSRLAAPILRCLASMKLRAVRLTLAGRLSSRVLDYGCGSGGLVAELRRRGIDAVGYDPSPSAVAFARGQGIPVFPEVPAGPFDLIMFWHSLEHTDDPAAVLESLRPHLGERAKLLIAVPNASSYEARIAGERWFHYDYPYHRVHFTPRALAMLLARYGFRIRSIDFLNPEYTVSGLVQTFLNYFLPKNVLYGVVSHRRLTLSRSRAVTLAILSMLLTVVFSPFLLGVWALAVLSGKSGAMIVLAERSA